MLDIKQELDILLAKTGIRSMNKLLIDMEKAGYNVQKPSTISTQLSKQRIRFELIQQMLNFMGYELVIKEKQK